MGTGCVDDENDDSVGCINVVMMTQSWEDSIDVI